MASIWLEETWALACKSESEAIHASNAEPNLSVTRFLGDLLLAARLGSGQALLQELDLAVVVGFVFAHVEPLAVIVRRPPAPGLVYGQQPGVVALAELSQSLLACLAQQIQIVVEVMAFDRLAPLITEAHSRAPFFFVITRQLLERVPFKCIQLIDPIGGGQVHEQRANRVGVRVE